MMQPKTTVAGIYGAGGEDASGNPDLKALVEGQGGTMFTSSVGGGDDEIIAYLKAGFEKGNDLKLYGHSRGGAAAVRIANKLGAMHINISEMTLYDPVGMYGGGSFNFDYPNVMKVTNYYQRNPIDGVAFWADNPFKGSPVSGSFQWPAINNVNLTGHYYRPGILMNHLNITRYAIKNP
jgi:pimeloyl-ACP methyl ester carboxylesterase